MNLFNTLYFFQPQIHAGAAETLTLWENLESVHAFAYYGVHGEAFKNRGEWFLKPEWPSYAVWWLEDDHLPTLEEAYERHKHLDKKGPSPYAFNLKKPFDDKNHPTSIDRHAIQK